MKCTLDTSGITFGMKRIFFLVLLLTGQRLPHLSPKSLPLNSTTLLPLERFSKIPTYLTLSLLYSSTISSNCSKLTQINPLSNLCAGVSKRVSGLGPILTLGNTLTHLISHYLNQTTLKKHNFYGTNMTTNSSKDLSLIRLETNFYLGCTACQFSLYRNCTPLT